MEEDISRYHTLLRDPNRRKIIEILGQQEKIGFKELRMTLGLGVGTVYYHLDMLDNFLTQDKQKKYMLNDRGRLLYKALKDTSLPATLDIGEALGHRLGRYLFLSPVFTRTTQPMILLPVAVLTFIFGAFGSALTNLDPALFFYFPYTTYQFETVMTLFFFNWIGLFLFSDLIISILYKHTGNELQLFTCLGIASIPLSAFPYLLLFITYEYARYFLLLFQIWSLLLISAAFCFGKGIRLDRAILISMTILYLNIMILVFLGRFP